MPFSEATYIESDTVLHGVCLGCGMCSAICFTKALHSNGMLQPGNGNRMPSLQPTLCVHCGNCAAVCPSDTILQPRFQQIAAEVREKQIQTMVFLCRNLLTLAPRPMEKKGLAPGADLLEAHISPRLDAVRAPQGARVDVVRCVHRVGPRFLDKLVEYGVRNVLLLACPEHDCRYQVNGLHRVSHIEMLNSVYQAYGINVRLEVRHLHTASLPQVQAIVDAFAAPALP